MKCLKCQLENPDGAKFCNACGHKFALVCSKCNQKNPPGSKFCNECGCDLSQPLTPQQPPETTDTAQQSLTRPESPPLSEGERRQATVVFSDLAGYTSMNERLDPEEVETIMSQIKKEAVDIVERHEGIVNQFVGDEVLALFGIPAAHEDDPVRAVRAAMELHELVRQISPEVEERIGIKLRMHTGISTGLVVTHLRDIRNGSYGITGDTVNRGARLAGRAKADEILVGPQSYSLIAPYFETEALKPVTVKGKSEPLIPYRVKGKSVVKTRFEASEKRGLTAFTGRDEELAILDDCLGKTMKGHGQFVTIIGEAGVGKSRLLYEFRHSLDRDKITVLQGICQSYGSNIPYFSFLDALKRGLQLREESTPAELHKKAISNILAIDPSLKPYIPLFLHLLSIPRKEFPLPEHLQGQELKHAIQDAFAAINTLSAKSRPLVLILEDWHWSDEASESTLNHLINVLAPYHLMVVVVYRPEYDASWQNRSYHSTIVLKALDSPQIENIIKAVWRVDRLPDGIVPVLQERTGGNPFFIEEVCRSLKEEDAVKIENEQAILTQKIDALEIPDSIQAIISSRLDRLDKATKEVLRLASVIGRDFNLRILVQLLSAKSSTIKALEKLLALEMIQQSRIVPEAEYRFKHVMIQEVVYETMLFRRRKDLHGRVGNIIEEVFSNRLEEHIDLLTHHFSLSENWQKAVHYGRQAAEKNRRLSQFQEAVVIYEKVHKWLERLPESLFKQESRIDILLQQERLYEVLGQREHQQKIIDQLLSLLKPLDAPTLLAEVKIRQGDLFTQLGYFNEAEQALDEALNAWRDISNATGESRTLRSMGFLWWHQNRYKEAIESNEAAMTIDRQRNDSNAIATDLTNLGSVWRNLGDYQQALACFRSALEIYKTTHNPLKQAFTRYSIAHVHREKGDLDIASKQYYQAHDIFSKHRDYVMSSRALAGMASILLEQGKPQESLDLFKNVVNMTRDIRYAQGLSHALCAIGELQVVLNEPQEALNHLLESTEIFAELKDRENGAMIWEKIAKIYEQNLEDYHNALSAWGKVQELRQLLNDECGALQALQQMGKLVWKNFTDPIKALQYYQEAFKLAITMNNRQKQGELLSAMGNIEWHRGANTEALSLYEQSVQIYQELEDMDHIGLMLNSIGVTLWKLERYEDALSRLRKAVAINRQAKQQLLEGHSLAALGDVYRSMGEPEQALNHYKASLKLRRKIGDRRGEGWMLHSLASVCAAQNSHTQAQDFMKKAYAIAQTCEDKDLLEACTLGQGKLKAQ